jgi:hypothetical protein
MIFLWVPETKQRTLEELDYIFAVPTRKHMSYQLNKALPYWFNRYILRRNVTLEPLYHFDHIATEDTFGEAVRKESVVEATAKTA